MFGQGLCDGVPAKLEADEQLRGNDGQHDPALSAKLVTIWVVKQLKGFSEIREIIIKYLKREYICNTKQNYVCPSVCPSGLSLRSR